MDTTLTMWSRLASPIMRQSNIPPPIMDVIGSTHYLQYSCQNVYTESSHGERDKIWTGDIIRDTGLNQPKYQCHKSKHRQGTAVA